MKKIGFILLLVSVFITSGLFAANPSKEIDNKCRQNLKALNAATKQMLEEKEYNMHPWVSLKQAGNIYTDFDKYIDVSKIVGPTPSCEYFMVYKDKNDYEWLCNLHGVMEGELITLKYHEYQLHGRINSKYQTNKEYEKHSKGMLMWTEYSLTPKEFFLYQYNTNPILTTVISIVLFVGSYLLLKSFFKF